MVKNQGVIFCRGVPARVILLSAPRSSAGHGAGAAPRRVAARAAWPPLRMGAGEGAGRVAKYNCIAVDKLGAKRTEPSRNHPGIIGSCGRIAKYDLAVADKPHAKRTEPSRSHPEIIGSRGRIAKYGCIAVDKLGAMRTGPSQNHPGICGSRGRIAKYDLVVADKLYAKRTEPSRNHPGTIGSCGRNANEGSRNHPEPSAEPSCFSESSTRNAASMASSRL